MRSDPVDLALRNIERLIDRDPLLRDILRPSLPTPKRQARFVPAVDVLETDGAWTIVMELPGVPKSEVHVRLDGSKLTIKGTKPPFRDGRTPVRERDVGPFSREFLVPYAVAVESISARLDDGVLRVELPRAAGSPGRTVPVD